MQDARAWAEIDLDAARANMQTLCRKAGPTVQVMAVVKGDAYGHGLLPVAQTAVEAGASWLGVAAVSEGASLRAAGLETPIALLCAPAPGEAEAVISHRLTAMAGDETTLEAIARAARPLIPQGQAPAIHLEIDTGMGRAGALPENAVALWQKAAALGLRVTGLATHYADADGPQETLSRQQEATFERALAQLEQAGARFDHIHLNNSAASLRFGSRLGNLIRPGLLLYGILPSVPPQQGEETSREEQDWGLRPVLTLKARVATIRALPAGATISYGATHRLARPSRVATVLIGYGDGYPRRLSNIGWMLLRGQRAPILGRVCMDQTVVDVTDIPGVVPGDAAACIGTEGKERLSVERIAALLQTTEHEITTCLMPRLPRLYLSQS